MKKRSLIFFLMLALLSGSAWAQSAYYSYSNITSSYSGATLYNNGTPANLFDNSLDTKYCPQYRDNTWPTYSRVDFESNDLIIPTGYVIYTGDDTQQYPGRNPKNWTIQAKVNSSDNWTTIHTVTNAGLPTTNKTAVTYSFSNTTAYKYFRFEITAIESGGIGQLQDFHFIATVQGEGFVLNQNLNEDLTCGGTTYKFYDSGGASGNYSNSENYTAIFNCNSNITITFTSFAVESYSSNYDYLTLYDGETQIAKLGGSSSTISSDITTATSYTATSGTLKAVWHSDGSTVKAGWNATITTGTCRYITEIYTPADWNAFCAAVNSGHDYSGETVTLMNDITTAVTTMAGETTGESTYNYAFKGTFDGQGHTLTVNLTSGTLSGSWYYTAPFRVIDGATIKNLKTTGTVTQNSGKGAAGLAGYTTGTCTITNCVSNVTINSLTDGDGTHGGFFSEIRGTTTMNNCAFTGSITGSSTRYCGGFVGWKSGTATFNNCVFAPTAITFDADHSGDNSANFSRNGGTFNNCYYTQTCGSVVQGKLMHSITGASGITVANAGTATSYTPETSTIVGYGTGIKFNNTLYAGSGDNVSLTLGASTSGIFYADNATITGNSNPYTLAMPNEDVVIRLGQGFTITATAEPTEGGSVTGSGTFAQGSSCTLTATANTGYAFANWTLNGVVVSTNASYTFTVSEDATYVANFEEWGVFITSTPASTENLTPGTEVVLTASTNVPYSPGLDQYVFNTGNDGSMITPQSWTTIVSSGNDDAASNVTGIGFTFTYDNVDYSNFSANSNGRMRLGDTKIATSYSNPFTSSYYTSNTPAIVGVGRDCSTGSAGYVRTGLYGSEGSYVRVIEFKLNTGSSATGTTYVMFQVQLFQANNEVRIVYSSDYSNAPSSYQIGIGNADHNKFWYVNPSAHSASYSTTYTSTTYSVYPGARRYYSFTPSTPIYNWTCNAGTAGTANDNVYTVTPTENSSYTVTTTINGQTYSETVEVTMQALTKIIAAYSNSQAEKGGYYLIASPLAAAIAPTDVDGMITDNLGNTATTSTSTYDLYSFNQAAALEWQNYRASNFNLVNGTGYLYASKGGTTLTFSGAPYSGTTKTVTLHKTTAATGLEFPAWNLVGNPFAGDAYITKSFYTLENSDTYTLNTAGTAIHPMQGLLVIADEDGETMTFSTEAPAINNSKLNMNVSNERSVVDQAISSFPEGQELPKLQFRNGSTKVYMPKDGKEYAIVSTEAMGTMPVNFKAENDGTYTLSFTAEEVSFSYLHLIDNMTGIETDLLANPSYSFDAKTTDYESRFKLVFATGNNANDDAFAFYSNGSFVINNEGEATLQVIDVNGRIFKSESINGCTNVNVKAAAGVYMLRLVNGNDVKVQKVVVR